MFVMFAGVAVRCDREIFCAFLSFNLLHHLYTSSTLPLPQACPRARWADLLPWALAGSFRSVLAGAPEGPEWLIP